MVYKKYQRKRKFIKKKKVFKKKRYYNNNKRHLKIPRPLNRSLGNQIALNLVRDYQFYINPRSEVGGLQQACSLRFCVNSVYPHLITSGTLGNWLQKGNNALVNPSDPIVGYSMESPNPGTATIQQGIYNQGDYSMGRRFESAYITNANLSIKAETVVGSSDISEAIQPGLLTLVTHNNIVTPLDASANVDSLKLLSNRVTKRINPLVNQSIAQGKNHYVSLSKSVNIAREHNVKDLADSKEEFEFSLGDVLDTGATSTAGIPNEKSFVTISYMPAMKAEMLGNPNADPATVVNIQPPPIILRVRLRQRMVCYNPRSHSQTSGVNFNLPKPQRIPDPVSTKWRDAMKMLAAQALLGATYGLRPKPFVRYQ